MKFDLDDKKKRRLHHMTQNVMWLSNVYEIPDRWLSLSAIDALTFLFAAFTRQKSAGVCEIADGRHPAAFPFMYRGQSAESCTQRPHWRANGEADDANTSSDTLLPSGCGFLDVSDDTLDAVNQNRASFPRWQTSHVRLGRQIAQWRCNTRRSRRHDPSSGVVLMQTISCAAHHILLPG